MTSGVAPAPAVVAVSSVAHTPNELSEKERKSRVITGPLFLDPETVDPTYAEPVVDLELDVTDPVPLHVVKGHFANTKTHFNFYLPPKKQWKGRFFQYAYPVQPPEALPADIAFGASAGAYTVQCTGSVGYRHEAATAKFSRDIASKYYDVERDTISGYVYGGSGGSFVSIAAMENSRGIWQGAVPFVQGTPYSMPDAQAIVAFGTMVLNSKIPNIRDAVCPGGEGDPRQSLSPLEREVFDEVSRHGVPIRGWEILDEDAENVKRLTMFYPYIGDMDPTYKDDFWSKDGYLGTEQSELGDMFRQRRRRGTLALDLDGELAGSIKELRVTEVSSDLDWRGMDWSVVDSSDVEIAKPRGTLDPSTRTLALTFPLEDVTIPAGAKLQYDNSWWTAAHAYFRYHLPVRAGFSGWDQYRNADGSPKHPQRPIEMGPIMSVGTSGGGTHTGKFSGKMIVIGNLMDIDAVPLNTVWYHNVAKETWGDELDDRYRVWFVDHAHHYNGVVDHPGKVIQYDGIYYQALKDLADWVEKDIPPARSSPYTVTDGQVAVPDSADERGGIQPVVRLSVNGQRRADVKAGDAVELQAEVTVPSGAGFIVRAEWDFTGDGVYTQEETVAGDKATLSLSTTHEYSTPGTFYPVLRVASERNGDLSETRALAFSLGRARVVVQ